MSISIKNFYLNTPMTCYEYMRLKLRNLPDDVIFQYNLREKVTKDGYVYTEIWRGMYRIPAAGIIFPTATKKAAQQRSIQVE